MRKILLLNGPNLNMLGIREPLYYGMKSLSDIVNNLYSIATSHHIKLTHLQTNAEHVMLEYIHNALNDGTEFIIINPAAWTHTSIAVRDALTSVNLPFIEVHLSNIHRREKFRHVSYLSGVALGVIAGLGDSGYEYALRYAINFLDKHPKTITV